MRWGGGLLEHSFDFVREIIVFVSIAAEMF